MLEHLEDRALPSSYTAASTAELIYDINAANQAGGSNTIVLEEELARPPSEMLGRLEAKLAVTRDVIEGGLPLPMAARKFQALDRDMPPSYWDWFRQEIPGRTDAERFCRQVVDFVARELRRMADGGRAHPDHDALLGRLRAELERLLADGSLELDD
jgi:hypothetical protein